MEAYNSEKLFTLEVKQSFLNVTNFAVFALCK